MTPNNKTKLKGGAQIRTLSLFAPAQTAKRIDCENYVEGYAARYEPYVLYYDGDTPICERFERGCFDNCDMGDIIYQYDHAGRVFARTSNGSLLVEPNQEGLFVAADLGRTQAARDPLCRYPRRHGYQDELALPAGRLLFRQGHQHHRA